MCEICDIISGDVIFRRPLLKMEISGSWNALQVYDITSSLNNPEWKKQHTTLSSNLNNRAQNILVNLFDLSVRSQQSLALKHEK